MRSIRCQLPSYDNLLRPCIIIDKPDIGRKAISSHDAYFTHDGAEIVYNKLADDIDQYAEDYGRIADVLWDKYFHCRDE